MHFSILVKIHSVEELDEITFSAKVFLEIAISMIHSQVSLLLLVDLKEHFPKFLNVLVKVASICHQVLNALPEENRLCIVFQSVDSKLRQGTAR